MNLDSLGIEVFLAIIKTQNLSKAAELLHLSQAAVSYRLKVLECEVGATLIQRNKGIQIIELTPLGKNFALLAERWSILQRELEDLKANGPQINLTIGAADSLNIYVLPPLYRELLRASSSLRLQVITQHTMESYKSMERKEIDAAFVKMERAIPNILVKPFYIDEMVVVRPNVPENIYPEPISPSTLDSLHEIYFNWGPSFQIWHEQWWDTTNRSRSQVDAAALIFALMQDARQWAIVPQSIANTFTATEQIAIQHLTTPPPPRIGYMLTQKHPDPFKSAYIEKLNQLVTMLYSAKISL
ncbi:MAG: hypothetical protein H6Q69_438 [Firmicutes bacterium]|nr:hypothetical protein [Bacillota bacterium]MBP2657406.1 hypothetical protein [Bacillota bacterium]